MQEKDIDFVKSLETISNLSFWSADDYLKEIDDSVSINLLIRENNPIGFIVVRLIMNQHKNFYANPVENAILMCWNTE